MFGHLKINRAIATLGLRFMWTPCLPGWGKVAHTEYRHGGANSAPGDRARSKQGPEAGTLDVPMPDDLDSPHRFVAARITHNREWGEHCRTNRYPCEPIDRTALQKRAHNPPLPSRRAICQRLLCGALSARGKSRVANPCDNAKPESFMKTLKAEEASGKAHATLDEARQDIGRFIDTVYNTQRLYSVLGY